LSPSEISPVDALSWRMSTSMFKTESGGWH
jgi:hypothetical protein